MAKTPKPKSKLPPKLPPKIRVDDNGDLEIVREPVMPVEPPSQKYLGRITHIPGTPGRYEGKFNAERKRIFLETMEQGFSISKCCRAAGISYHTALEHKNKDKDFAEMWAAAYDVGTDAYEDEAKRRAFDGIDKPVMYQGEVVAYVREYSDKILLSILASRRPDKWKGEGGVSVTVGAPVTGITRKVIDPSGKDITKSVQVEDAEIVED